MDNLDNLENKTAAPQPDATSGLEELRAQYDALSHLVVSLLVLLLIVSGSFNLFLLRQVKYARTDLQAVRPQITQMLAEYNKVSAPAIQNLIKQLTDYGRTHPDFVPILTKYGLKPGITPNLTPAAATGSAAP